MVEGVGPDRRRLFQDTNADRPTFVTSLAALGNQPAILFDGVSQYLESLSAEWLAGTAGHVLLVMVPTDVAGWAYPLTASDETFDTKYLIIGQGGNELTYSQRNADSPDTLTSDGTMVADSAYIVRVDSDGATITAKINNVTQVLTEDAGANNGDWWDSFGPTKLVLGGLDRDMGFTNPYEGYLGYVAIIADGVTESQLNAAYRWLKRKFRL
jgi:hypothetical protein